MGFALSSVGTRLLGHSFCSITISLLKKGFTRKISSLPKKPLDLDSFLWPVIQELLQLEIGVSAFDALLQSIFTLHAYLIVVFGDIPAVSLIMRMKGHNTIVPCRMCEIRGIRKPGAKTHYMPWIVLSFQVLMIHTTHLLFRSTIMHCSSNKQR